MPVVRFIPGGEARTAPASPLSAAELAAAAGVDDDTAARLLDVANELIERYAPAAPAAVKREAIIRCAGWLHGQPADSIRSREVGPMNVSYTPSMLSSLRHSGAMALLSAWKVRRGGMI